MGTARADLMEAAKTFFVALYHQQPGASMASARFTMFTKKKKSPKIQALPPTSSNLLLHVLWAHLQVKLCSAEGKTDVLELQAGEIRGEIAPKK